MPTATLTLRDAWYDDAPTGAPKLGPFIQCVPSTGVCVNGLKGGTADDESLVMTVEFAAVTTAWLNTLDITARTKNSGGAPSPLRPKV